METLLHINSNRDDHSDYTKTRVADQTGNFIILGPDSTYSPDHKFPMGNMGTGYSLYFDGNTQYQFNDYQHSFNFSNREFSFEAWVKFEGDVNTDKKHVILSKWSNDFLLKHNKIFRWSYIHNGTIPGESTIKFEFAGALGYENETYPKVTLRGYDVEYDGEYTFDANIQLPSKYANYHTWVGEHGLLMMHHYEDPDGYAESTPSDKGTPAAITGNYITNSSYLKDWHMSNAEWELNYDRRDTLRLPTTSGDSYIASELPMELKAGNYRLGFLIERGETISESSFDAYFNKKPTPTTYKGWYSQDAALSKGPEDDIANDVKISVYHQGILSVGTTLYLDEALTTPFVLSPDDRWIYSREHVYAMRLVGGEVVEVGHHSQIQDIKVKILNKFIGTSGTYESSDVVYSCDNLTSDNEIVVGVNDFEVDIPESGKYYIVVEGNGNDSVSNLYLRGLSCRTITQYEGTHGVGKMFLVKPPSEPSAECLTTGTHTISTVGSGQAFVVKFTVDGETQSVLTMGVGCEYVFTNTDPSGHKFKISDKERGDGGDYLGTWSSAGGGVITWTPTETGTFYYWCANHEGMGGEVHINESCSCEDYDFETMTEVTTHMEDANHHNHICGNLQDGNWHYLYLASVSLDADSLATFSPAIDIGVDDTYTRITDLDTEDTATIKYIDNPDSSPDRIEYLSSIQPHFQHGSDLNYFNKCSVQPVMIGADDISTDTMQGQLDTLRISEYPIYDNEQEYMNRDKESAPLCVVNVTGIDCVSKYDQHTEYEFPEQTPIVDIKVYEPTHADTENPSNSIELYKKQIGSMEYLKKFWSNPDQEPSQADLDKWRWELKFMRVPWYLDRTQSELDKWDAIQNVQFPVIMETLR